MVLFCIVHAVQRRTMIPCTEEEGTKTSGLSDANKETTMLTATRLTCNYQTYPMGIDERVRF